MESRYWSRLSSLQYLTVLACVIALVVPLVFRPKNQPFLINTLIWFFYFAYLSSSWNLCAGITGILSFGHVAFVGIGAYSTALAYTSLGVSPWIGMWIGVALSLLASLIIGVASLRMKGIYFTLLTIVFLLVLQTVCVYWVDVTGGSKGIVYKQVPFSFWDFQFNTDKTPYYYIIFGMVLAVTFFLKKLKASKWGYYFIAIREDDELAEVSGIDVTRYKLISTLISSALMSLGGSFYAQFALVLDPYATFNLNVMLKIIAPAIVGGLGTIIGPIVGSFAVIPLAEIIRVYLGYIPGLHLVFYGLVLIIVCLFQRSIGNILFGERR